MSFKQIYDPKPLSVHLVPISNDKSQQRHSIVSLLDNNISRMSEEQSLWMNEVIKANKRFASVECYVAREEFVSIQILINIPLLRGILCGVAWMGWNHPHFQIHNCLQTKNNWICLLFDTERLAKANKFFTCGSASKQRVNLNNTDRLGGYLCS